MARGAAKRYTQAIFGLAREKGAFDQWQADLARLDALMRDERAAVYLESPNVSTAEKQALLDAVLADGSTEARNLARLLLRRGRLRILAEIAEAFEAALLEERGIAVAEVTTAEPLDAAGEAVVRQKLEQLIGREIRLMTKIDPAIIGGIVARVGDQVIDGSVINQLRRLRARLASAT